MSRPKKHKNLPVNAQWLSGEGAGSWFNLEILEGKYVISRYSPDGRLECEGFFYPAGDSHFDCKSPYQFVYMSHCDMVTIKQDSRTIMLRRLF